MARHFDIRDLSMVQRLQSQARPLSTHLVVVGGVSPLPQAMLSFVAGALDNTICLVEHSGDADSDAFGLMQVLPDESSADVARQRGAALILMAPVANTEAQGRAWVSLALGFAEQAGERGVHHIIADVLDGSAESLLLQAAGFVPMIQQDLMKLARAPQLGDKGEKPAIVSGLREATNDDAPMIRALHLRTAPRMTYPAERTADALFDALRVRRGWVLERNSEILGHIGFWHGRRGRAMRCLFRPEAFADARDAIAFVLHASDYRRATYCNIRHYQNWLLPIFESLGFAHLGSTMLMTKYTTARAPELSPLRALIPQFARARKTINTRFDTPGERSNARAADE